MRGPCPLCLTSSTCLPLYPMPRTMPMPHTLPMPPLCLLLAPLVQNVTNGFTRLCQDPRITYLGNVQLGVQVELRELRELFNAVSPIVQLA